MSASPQCDICRMPYEGMGHNAFPVTEGRCCSACNDIVVGPLRMARVIARDGAQKVAEFALMVARQRAQLSPPGRVHVKDMALLTASVLIHNAIERVSAAAEPQG